MTETLDEDAIKLVTQRFRNLTVDEARRILELMVLGDYGGIKASRAVLGTDKKKDTVLRLKKAYLEIANSPKDDALDALKEEAETIKHEARLNEGIEKREAEKARMRKVILIGRLSTQGNRMVLMFIKNEPALHERFMAFCLVRNLGAEKALHVLDCTDMTLLSDAESSYEGKEPWRLALIKLIQKRFDEKMPTMPHLEARQYMQTHFPGQCPECNGVIIAYPVLGKTVIGCISARHLYVVRCPNPSCDSLMKPRNSGAYKILTALVCPKCKEAWKKGINHEWPEKYCIRAQLP